MLRSAACAAVVLALAAPARGTDLPPSCGPGRDGVQVCMAHQVCVCGRDAGGTLTGRAPGWRWRCDILQSCGMEAPAALPEGGGEAWPGPLYVSPNLNLPNLNLPGPAPPPTPRRR